MSKVIIKTVRNASSVRYYRLAVCLLPCGATTDKFRRISFDEARSYQQNMGKLTDSYIKNGNTVEVYLYEV